MKVANDKSFAREHEVAGVAINPMASVTCAFPDVRYTDPSKSRTDLVYMEEAGTLWLWAFPELLRWHTGITWLFSPPGRNRWDGDLWGIDDDGNFVLVEAKCASHLITLR